MNLLERRKYMIEKRRKAKLEGMCQNCYKVERQSGKTCCSFCLEAKKLHLKFGTADQYREVYATLFEKQLGKCAICQQDLLRPAMDHCHKTREVRGLLCTRCNVGLGYFKDDSSWVKRAYEYLETSRTGIFFKKEKSQGGSKPGSKRSPLVQRMTKKGYLVLD